VDVGWLRRLVEAARIGLIEIKETYGATNSLKRQSSCYSFESDAPMGKTLIWVRIAAMIAALFGFATIYSGGMALFGGEQAAAAVGNAVPIVLWFNFCAGFLYVLTAVGLFLRLPWAGPLAWVIGVSTLIVFGIFIVLVLSGTAFEWRTVGAMVLRSGFWLGIAFAMSQGPGMSR
jgi:hypothetical protein